MISTQKRYFNYC